MIVDTFPQKRLESVHDHRGKLEQGGAGPVDCRLPALFHKIRARVRLDDRGTGKSIMSIETVINIEADQLARVECRAWK
jgi:hypothetical protein